MVRIFSRFSLYRDPTMPPACPRETRVRVAMDVHSNGVQSEVEFWPIEHPTEPLDEDRPVKCPMPDSSIINLNNVIFVVGRTEICCMSNLHKSLSCEFAEDRQVHEEWFSESLRKRTGLSAAMNKDGMVMVAAEPPVRAVRKRHHTLTQENQKITPLLRMPPLHPLSTQSITVFEMLQHFNKFES